MTKKEQQALIDYWEKSSSDDWKTFQTLKKARRFPPALFFLHLALEKKLKALVSKNSGAHPPMSHSLTYLAGKAGLDVPQKLLDSLEVLSGFNLSSRYPDEKFQFHKLADAKFVKVWEGRAKEFLKWLQDSQN